MSAMKKSVIFALGVGLSGALCLSGCFSIDCGRLIRTDEEHVLVSNYGWYLFNLIPLACGNADERSSAPFMFFRNDVTMDKIQRRFMMYADEYGRRMAADGADAAEPVSYGKTIERISEHVQVHDLAYTTRESVLFEIPSVNFPFPIPYILTYREIQLSGVLGRAHDREGQP